MLIYIYKISYIYHPGPLSASVHHNGFLGGFVTLEAFGLVDIAVPADGQVPTWCIDDITERFVTFITVEILDKYLLYTL
jgi:hypothetical protein